MTEPEPTIADVLAAVSNLRDEMYQAVDGLRLTIREDGLVLRNDIQRQLDIVRAALGALHSQGDTLIDAIADVRRDLKSHTHDEAPA